MSNLDIRLIKAKLEQLEKEYKRVDLVNVELSSLRTNATVYQRKTNTNILFLVEDIQALKTDKKKELMKVKNDLEKTKKELDKLARKA
ncbi:hypothetical protein RhiirA1_535323 [Rhizophagus irregularis]|uniref:Uncharacterized protein n=3 Tax=Rhizophagus irregularis TaxID=588596 RepID=A0A2N1NSJ9_9GLOM|nr:hypothetical protein GLOIN_2v1761903 [Rhizophagus irregularis DAOM 181602=DAOM 197198]EXX76055.1 hypothetical protein RirG_036720 [Rhizophagus irregularis DAOM 197198w]PKC66848.1 hypothetical protein RhiirA1_535323 [Rhizophagus irregularis]RGB40975.1 hypothetical protein C1646_752623 [Rhizophagus diaphanus] [Rhizophagus sp. MUCL 43196]PKK76877.1 hypothetical protein RhiirC2_771955 [Rhizophagus irregularis]POG82507.1 hypothetical protein GLOIN_2v1761903 [Rhizophagus irregularis DAOM 181602=D|eukprot:XP_025189373.1 hypothetical protein GLOIN_2v1761903 [Rhizophagus irregularis DAOM 181602=DAOM 197198]